MSAEELLTPRLRLRRLRDSDLEAMTAINRDPEVTEFLSQPVDEEATERFLEKTSSHWEEHGFGHWALELRQGPDQGGLIGFAGVAYPSFLLSLAHRTEIGWRLARPVWGQGLATEAALVVRDDAFDRLGLAELISIIDPQNARSRRVAQKLGMGVEGHDTLHGRTVEVWVLSATDS
jgi:RimJ/RimL family protein N-acetyltransferase